MISVIIPVYNTREYLGKCINSVKTQSFKDWECIIVDDGSTDGSDALIYEYTRNDSRFRAFYTENRGLARARNLGMDKANGDWFFLDSDDYLLPGALSYLSRKAENNVGVGRIIGLEVMQYEKYGWMIPWDIKPAGIHYQNSPYFFTENCDPGHATACLYIRKNLPNLRFRDVKFEDMIFNMELMLAGCPSYVTEKYIYNYVRRDDSLVTKSISEIDAAKALGALEEIAEKYSADKELHARFKAFLTRALNGKLNNQ